MHYLKGQHRGMLMFVVIGTIIVLAAIVALMRPASTPYAPGPDIKPTPIAQSGL